MTQTIEQTADEVDAELAAPTPSEITKPAPGIYPDMSAEFYHSVRAVSSTSLKKFILHSPAKCKAVLDGKIEEETATMKMGTALHAAVLEPKMFDSMYRIGENHRRNSKKWIEFEKQCDADGVKALKASENADIIGMRDRLWSERSIAKILSACEHRELSVFWNDEASGLYCKARLDIHGEKYGSLLDLKGTSDARRDKFENIAFNAGYHIQIPWYALGARAVGLAVNMSGILAVEFEPSYEPCIFEVAGDLFERGMNEINNALPVLAECYETGVWPGLMKDGRPVQLRAPRRANYQEISDE